MIATKNGSASQCGRRWWVLISTIAAIVAAFLGSGAVVGTPITEASGGWLDADVTPLAPASGAFRIWSVIYLGLLVYAIWRLTAGRSSTRGAAADLLVVASAALNALWIIVVQLDLLVLSLPVIIVLLVTLALLIRRLSQSEPPSTRAEALVLDGVMGLYLGWVAAATIANTAAIGASLEPDGLPIDILGASVLAVAGLIGVAMAFGTGGRIAPSLSFAWALTWIAIARTEGNFASDTLVWAAGLAAAAVVIGTATARLRRSKQPAL